ncbi:electron transport complex protein RnfC [Lachnospiraceae bacterium NK3A20]|nr:electron transport complex protein RnfC [Lachnospiraceae bacterium NK3A20]
MLFRKKHLTSIDAGHYKNTADKQTEVMPVPAMVKLSMSQNIGAPCKPLVKKGDAVKVGTLIGDTDAFLSVPVHSSVSGTVTDIETVRNAMGGMDTLVDITADGLQTEEEFTAPVIESQPDFIKAMRASGLVGLGGASFPSWVKFNPKNLIDIDTLIVNGAECEPYITSDHRTMLENAQDVLDGAEAMMKWLQAENGYIAIENNKQNAIDNFNRLIAEQKLKNLHVFPLQARYPKGAERVLIYEVTGKQCDAGVLPASLGVIVSNITSTAFMGQYLRTGRPLVEKRLTIDGDAVAEPKNVMLPIGTTIHDAIAFCGGYRTEPRKILMGGPMMGRAVFSDEVPIVKANNAILAFTKEKAELPEETACIHCGRCHEACPFDLLPTAYADAYESKDVNALRDLQVMQCMECGSCSYVCPAHRPLAFMNKLGKAMVKEADRNARK